MRDLATLDGEIVNRDGDITRDPGGRRKPLDRTERIRRQLARLYWKWNDGTLPSEELTKAAYVLKTMHSMIEGGETAKRLADLEAKVAGMVQQ